MGRSEIKLTTTLRWRDGILNTTATKTVLVVEDDRKISDLLVNYLQTNGYEATAVYDGINAVRIIKYRTPHIVILDWMLPGMDGLSLCKEVRTFSDVPILMLTARVDEVDRLSGLDMGADDYVCKPFAPREVIARVRALLRRADGKVKTAPTHWEIDEASFRIGWRGQWLPLTKIEFMMFRLLLSRPNRVFSRHQLMNSVHDSQRDISDRAIDTHIKNLRKKLQDIDPDSECIASVYGVGYRFDHERR